MSAEAKSLLLERHGDLLVVNKPHGWPTSGHTLADPDCVQWLLMQEVGGMVWAAHQLDADTSGVCLFACNKKLVTQVQELLSRPETRKEYLAIVSGEPDWEEIEERSPIGRIDERTLGVHSAGKPARSVFRVLDRRGGFAVIAARIFTGRTHQIRIHLSHLGHPLVGEEWYANPPCKLHFRQALHARSIHFAENGILPVDTVSAPLPADLLELAERLGLRLE